VIVVANVMNWRSDIIWQNSKTYIKLLNLKKESDTAH